MQHPEMIPPDFREFSKGIPLKENCDPGDPYQMFLWMFVALPYLRGGPLMMPLDYYQFVSKRLHDLGCMLQCENCGHAKTPKLRYQPPGASDPNWATAPGQWVPVDQPSSETRRPAAIAADTLLTQQQWELFDELWKRLSAEQRKTLIDKNQVEFFEAEHKKGEEGDDNT